MCRADWFIQYLRESYRRPARHRLRPLPSRRDGSAIWPIGNKILKAQDQWAQFIWDLEEKWRKSFQIQTRCDVELLWNLQSNFVNERAQNNPQGCLLRTRWGKCWTSSWEPPGMVSSHLIWMTLFSFIPNFNGKCKQFKSLILLHTESCKISNLEFYFLGQIRFNTESISNAFAAPVCTYYSKINNLLGGRIEEKATSNLRELEWNTFLGFNFYLLLSFKYSLKLFSSALLKCLKENAL